MDPITTGALIGAGGSLLGGAFSNFSNKSSAKKAIKFQENLARYGVRWRVKDAKAAGLHPLFGLGAQIPQSSPVVVQDSVGPAIAAAGQEIGRAVSANDPIARRERLLALEALQRGIDESDARIAALRAGAARDLREANQAFTFPIQDFGDIGLLGQGTNQPWGKNLPEYSSLDTDRTYVQAAKDFSRQANNPSVQAGSKPFWQQYDIDNGVRAYFPYSDEGPLEGMGEVPLFMWPGIIQYNAKHLSDSEMAAFLGFLGFNSVEDGLSWAWESLKKGFTKQ